jgi:hypothetical protein
MSGLPSQEINVLYVTLGGVLSSIKESKVSNGTWIQETGKEYEGGVNMLTSDSIVRYSTDVISPPYLS